MSANDVLTITGHPDAAKLRQIAVGYDAELYINQQYRVFALALKEITCRDHSDLFLIHSASMIFAGSASV